MMTAVIVQLSETARIWFFRTYVVSQCRFVAWGWSGDHGSDGWPVRSEFILVLFYPSALAT